MEKIPVRQKGRLPGITGTPGVISSLRASHGLSHLGHLPHSWQSSDSPNHNKKVIKGEHSLALFKQEHSKCFV